MMHLMKSMVTQQHKYIASQYQSRKSSNQNHLENAGTDEDDIQAPYNHENAIRWMQTFYYKGKSFSSIFEDNLEGHLEDIRVNGE